MASVGEPKVDREVEQEEEKESEGEQDQLDDGSNGEEQDEGEVEFDADGNALQFREGDYKRWVTQIQGWFRGESFPIASECYLPFFPSPCPSQPSDDEYEPTPRYSYIGWVVLKAKFYTRIHELSRHRY